MSVDLPLPVLPDDRGRLAGPGREGDGVEDRLLGARVAELDVVELHEARPADGRGLDRTGRVRDRGLGAQHLLDASRRDRGARHQDEHEDGGQHREEDLAEVLEERGQGTDLHRPAVDAHRPEPHDRDRREPEDHRDDRDRDREQAAGLERRLEQVVARDVEARLLAAGLDERPDDADPDERLAHDLVDPVDLDLHRPEERDRAAHDQTDHEGHQRQDRPAAAPTAGHRSGAP